MSQNRSKHLNIAVKKRTPVLLEKDDEHTTSSSLFFLKDESPPQNDNVYRPNLSKVHQSLTLHRKKEENLTKEEYYEIMEENFQKMLAALSMNDEELKMKLDEASVSIDFGKKIFGKKEPETKEERLSIYITAIQHESVLYYKKKY